jgi:hypothetical protein
VTLSDRSFANGEAPELTTSQQKPKAKRGRRLPDPLAAVTDELRAWFDADPASTGRQLQERLQEIHIPDVIRTVWCVRCNGA